MTKRTWLIGAAMLILLAGCGNGETSDADVNSEVSKINAQAPKGDASKAIDPGNDMMQMGGGGSGDGGNTMPKGTRGK